MLVKVPHLLSDPRFWSCLTPCWRHKNNARTRHQIGLPIGRTRLWLRYLIDENLWSWSRWLSWNRRGLRGLSDGVHQTGWRRCFSTYINQCMIETLRFPLKNQKDDPGDAEFFSKSPQLHKKPYFLRKPTSWFCLVCSISTDLHKSSKIHTGRTGAQCKVNQVED